MFILYSKVNFPWLMVMFETILVMSVVILAVNVYFIIHTNREIRKIRDEFPVNRKPRIG